MDNPFSIQMVSLKRRTALAAPKVAEFSVTIRIDRRPDDVIMNVRFVYVSADHKGVIALGEPLGKFHAQAVGFSGVISPGLKDWRTW